MKFCLDNTVRIDHHRGSDSGSIKCNLLEGRIEGDIIEHQRSIADAIKLILYPSDKNYSEIKLLGLVDGWELDHQYRVVVLDWYFLVTGSANHRLQITFCVQ